MYLQITILSVLNPCCRSDVFPCVVQTVPIPVVCVLLCVLENESVHPDMFAAYFSNGVYPSVSRVFVRPPSFAGDPLKVLIIDNGK